MDIKDNRIQDARTYALGTRRVSENRPTDEKLLGMAEAAEAVFIALGIPLDGDHWLDKTPIGDI